jgi:hypothetical protein
MSYIAAANTSEGMLESSLSVVCMVEEIDGIKLTDEERIALSVFFAFMSLRSNEVISDDMVGVMLGVGADWYTSVVCSNITWIKSIIRHKFQNGSIDKSTSINSLLGSILLGNMCNFAPLAPHSSTVWDERSLTP